MGTTVNRTDDRKLYPMFISRRLLFTVALAASPSWGTPANMIFEDDFESGNASAWTSVVGLDPCPGGSSEAVYYWGDFVTNLADNVALLEYPGGVPAVLPLNVFSSGDEIYSLAVSPDGATIAVAGRDTSADMAEIWLYAADGTGLPQLLLEATELAVDFDLLRFSPDGAWLAYISDPVVNNGNSLYVVPTTGGSQKLASQEPTTSSNDVTAFRWMPGSPSTHIAYRGDLVTTINQGVWTVDITVPVPAPVSIVATGAGFDLDFDQQGRLYFSSDFEGLRRLYRADLDGQNLVQVPGTDLSNGSEAAVSTFDLLTCDNLLAFSAEAPTAALYEVYVLDLDGGDAELVSGVSTLPPSATEGATMSIVWSPGGERLAVLADWRIADTDPGNDFHLFVLPASGPPGGARVLSVPVGANQDVLEIVFAANGARIFARGDVVTNNDTVVVSTSDFVTEDQNPASLLEQDVPTGGDVDAMATPR